MAGSFSSLLRFVVDADDKATNTFEKIGKNADKSLGKIPGHTTAIGTSIENAAAKSPLLTGALDKVGLSGQQAGSAITTALPGAMLVAGGAVAAFGVHAFGTFQDLAASVLDFQRIIGTSAEESSAFVAVLDDYAISAETGAKAIGKMAKAAANTPESFSKFGIEIAKNKDGTTDLQGTLLNAAEAYQNTGDDATRAALGAAIFGKSYAELIPILEKGADGADGLAEAFANVEGQQILSQDQIDQAENTRLALDELGDAAGELTIALGSALSPAVEKASGLLTVLAEGVNTATGALKLEGDITVGTGQAIRNWIGEHTGLESLTKNWSDQEEVLSDWAISAAAVASVQQNLVGSTNAVEHALGLEADASDIAAGKRVAAALATKEAEQASKDMQAALEAEATRHRDAAAAIAERTDAMRAATDTSFAVRDATDDFFDALEGLDGKIQEIEDSEASQESKQRDQQRAMDDATKSAVALADANVTLASEQATATGKTLTATEKLDTWNGQMLTAASTASGLLRQSILDYIASVNGIPPEKVSEILALIDQGKLAEAHTLLNDASKTRTADINADAHTAEAEGDLTHLTRDRNVRVFAKFHNVGVATGGVVEDGGVRHAATGAQGPGFFNVGEQGPETVVLPNGSRLLSRSESIEASRPRGGNTVRIDNVNLFEATDVDMFARRLLFALAAA